MIEYITPWVRYLFLIIFGYLISISLKHILDKNVTKFRIDNYLLYLLATKTPTASTKIVLKSKKRPDVIKIKKGIEEEFILEKNEAIKNNSFIFKIRNHPTPMKITLIEPDKDYLFTIILETFGEDKLPKLFKSTFSDSINYLEKINKKLSGLEFKSINVSINISCYFGNEEGLSYNYNKNVFMSSKNISCSGKNFTDIGPLVKECLKNWRNKFL